MTEVGIKALKNQLSMYLRLVSGGERIVVTERGRPIAVLSGIEEAQEVRGAWDLVDSGLASWGGGKPRGSENPPRVKGKSTAAMVTEDRR